MHFEHLIYVGAVFAGSLVAFLFLRLLALKVFKTWAERRPGSPGPVIYSSVRLPSLFWPLCGAAAVAIGLSDFSEKVSLRLSLTSETLFIFSVTWALASALVGVTARSLKRIQSPMAESGLIFGLIRSAVFTIGILIIFDTLKIAITPILTAMGVAGLAVALALKDTLENLFSGVHLLIDKAVLVGDTVKIETGQEGVIQDIGWRTTKLRMSDGQMLILPNVRFAQGILIRMMPTRG